MHCVVSKNSDNSLSVIGPVDSYDLAFSMAKEIIRRYPYSDSKIATLNAVPDWLKNAAIHNVSVGVNYGKVEESDSFNTEGVSIICSCGWSKMFADETPYDQIEESIHTHRGE